MSNKLYKDKPEQLVLSDATISALRTSTAKLFYSTSITIYQVLIVLPALGMKAVSYTRILPHTSCVQHKAPIFVNVRDFLVQGKSRTVRTMQREYAQRRDEEKKQRSVKLLTINAKQEVSILQVCKHGCSTITTGSASAKHNRRELKHA